MRRRNPGVTGEGCSVVPRLFACAGLVLSSPAPLPAAAAEAAGAVLRASPDADGVQRIRMVGGSYFFKPSHIVVKARVPVEISIVKEPGAAPHTFVLEAPQAGISINTSLGAEPRTIAFTPTAAGKYAFYCDSRFLFMASHKEKGMEGVLEVVD